MTKIYVLHCDIEEIENKSLDEITDNDFITLGQCYSLKEFEDWLNDPIKNYQNININNCWFKFM